MRPITLWLGLNRRRYFEFSRALLRQGIGDKDDILRQAESLYAEYRHAITDDWRERRIANGEKEEDFRPELRAVNYQPTILGLKEMRRKQENAKPAPPPASKAYPVDV